MFGFFGKVGANIAKGALGAVGGIAKTFGSDDVGDTLITAAKSIPMPNGVNSETRIPGDIVMVIVRIGPMLKGWDKVYGFQRWPTDPTIIATLTHRTVNDMIASTISAITEAKPRLAKTLATHFIANGTHPSIEDIATFEDDELENMMMIAERTQAGLYGTRRPKELAKSRHDSKAIETLIGKAFDFWNRVPNSTQIQLSRTYTEATRTISFGTGAPPTTFSTPSGNLVALNGVFIKPLVNPQMTHDDAIEFLGKTMSITVKKGNFLDIHSGLSTTREGGSSIDQHFPALLSTESRGTISSFHAIDVPGQTTPKTVCIPSGIIVTAPQLDITNAEAINRVYIGQLATRMSLFSSTTGPKEVCVMAGVITGDVHSGSQFKVWRVYSVSGMVDRILSSVDSTSGYKYTGKVAYNHPLDLKVENDDVFSLLVFPLFDVATNCMTYTNFLAAFTAIAPGHLPDLATPLFTFGDTLSNTPYVDRTLGTRWSGRDEESYGAVSVHYTMRKDTPRDLSVAIYNTGSGYYEWTHLTRPVSYYQTDLKIEGAVPGSLITLTKPAYGRTTGMSSDTGLGSLSALFESMISVGDEHIYRESLLPVLSTVIQSPAATFRDFCVSPGSRELRQRISELVGMRLAMAYTSSGQYFPPPMNAIHTHDETSSSLIVPGFKNV